MYYTGVFCVRMCVRHALQSTLQLAKPARGERMPVCRLVFAPRTPTGCTLSL